MSRRLLLAALASAAISAALPSAATAADPPPYCEGGRFCIAVATEKGQVHLRLLLMMKATRYRLCVTPPADSGADRTCKTFRVRTIGTVRGGDVRWSRHFPNEGSGTYKVRWSVGGKTLGKTLRFTRG